MRKYRLSQDALFALSQKSRYRGRGYSIKKFIAYLTGLSLALAAMLFAGCTTSTSPEMTNATWECTSASHIKIAFDSYDNYGYGYYRLFVGNEVTECRTPLAELTDMLKDGYWEQIEIGDPLFLPPPPYWSSRPQTQGTGIRINGSVCISMQTRTPLPNDNWITVLQGGVN